MTWRFPLAVCFYLQLGWTLAVTRGLYRPDAAAPLLALAASFALVAAALLARRPPAASSGPVPCPSWMPTLLATVLLAEAGMLMQSLRLLFVADDRWLAPAGWLQVILLAAGAGAWLVSLAGARLSRRWIVVPLVAAGIALILLRLVTLELSPHPRIDVWSIGNLGADSLLGGRNPYASGYGDVYQGRSDYRPAFFYGPAYLYWVTPFRAWFGDVRFGTIAADIVTAALVLAIGSRRRLGSTVSWLLVLVWLANPVSLFVLEQAWVDPLLIAAVAGVALSMLYGRWALVGVLLGCIVGVKQYGILAVGFTLAWIWMHHRQAIVRVCASLFVTTAALFGPFLWMDAGAFFRSTVQVYIDVAPRRDAFSLTSWLLNAHDVLVPQWLLVGVYGAAVGSGILWLWRARRPDPRDWAVILPVVYGIIFMLGKLAFCNYYYFVGFLVINYVLLDAECAASPSSRLEGRVS